jgi:hypothetical protein
VTAVQTLSRLNRTKPEEDREHLHVRVAVVDDLAHEVIEPHVTLLLPGNPFWVFDERLVRFSLFGGEGQVVGHQFTEAPLIVDQCVTAFTAVWDLATDHEEFQLPPARSTTVPSSSSSSAQQPRQALADQLREIPAPASAPRSWRPGQAGTATQK